MQKVEDWQIHKECGKAIHCDKCNQRYLSCDCRSLLIQITHNHYSEDRNIKQAVQLLEHRVQAIWGIHNHRSDNHGTNTNHQTAKFTDLNDFRFDTGFPSLVLPFYTDSWRTVCKRCLAYH